jgi:putative nucleotidyltransferase with HDIG domain
LNTETAKPERPWALRLTPPFPTVANRLLALVGDEDVSAKQIASLIQTDPTFTAELLRIANSALFRFSREVTSVPHAVTLLGLERVKSVATVVGLNAWVRSAVKIGVLRRMWIHSLVTAMLCEEAARSIGMAAETAYTAGLLHNLGSLGMMSAYPEAYGRMLDVSAEFGYDLLQTERDLFEIDHCAAGAHLAREWRFPEDLVTVALEHHEAPSEGEKTLVNVVQVCWRLADVLGFQAYPPERSWEYADLLAYLPEQQVESWLELGQEEAKVRILLRLRDLEV